MAPRIKKSQKTIERKIPTDAETKSKKVGFSKLFRYTESCDVILIVVGCLFSVVHGLTLPLLIVFFGHMVELLINTERLRYFLEVLMKDFLIMHDTHVEFYFLNTSKLTDKETCEDINPFLMTHHNLTCKDFPIHGKILDLMFFDHGLHVLMLAGGVFVVAGLEHCLWTLAAQRQSHRVRRALVTSVMNQDMAWFDLNPVLAVRHRLMEDVLTIKEGVDRNLGGMVQWKVTSLGCIVSSMYHSWELGLLLACGCFVIVLAEVGSVQCAKYDTISKIRKEAPYVAILRDVIKNMSTVVIHGGQEKEKEHFKETCRVLKYVDTRRVLLKSVSLGIIFCLIDFYFAFGFYVGTGTDNGNYIYRVSTFVIVFFSMLVAGLAEGVSQGYEQFLTRARQAAFEIYGIIDLKPTMNNNTNTIKPTFNASIEFKDVTFAYPSHPDILVLDKCSFKVATGCAVALITADVGVESRRWDRECTHRAVTHLLLRFYDPQSGVILVDGVDIKTVDVRALRRSIGYVDSARVLFSTSIARNIQFTEGKTVLSCKAAAEMANAMDFISELPGNFAFKHVRALTDSQTQRICIARALINNPRVLVLDEPTRDMDQSSTGFVQDVISRITRVPGRTSFIIPSSQNLDNVDIVIYFKDGKVAQMGNPVLTTSQDGYIKAYVMKKKLENAAKNEAHPEKYKGIIGKRKFSKESMSSVSRVMAFRDHRRRACYSDLSLVKEEVEKIQSEHLAGLHYRRVLRYQLRQWYLLLLGCLAAVGNGLIYPWLAYVFAQTIMLFSEPAGNTQSTTLEDGLVALIAIGCAHFCSMMVQHFCFERAGQILTRRLKEMVFTSIISQTKEWLDDPLNNADALVSKLHMDTSLVHRMTGMQIGRDLGNVALVISMLTIAIKVNLDMALLLLIPGTLSILLVSYIEQRVLDSQKEDFADALEKVGDIATESILNVKLVVSLNAENVIPVRYMEVLKGPYEDSLCHHNWIVAVTHALTQCICILLYAALFAMGAWFIEDSKGTCYDVLLIYSVIMFSTIGLSNNNLSPNAAKSNLAAQRVIEIIDSAPAYNQTYAYKMGRTLDVPSEGYTISFNEVVLWDEIKKEKVLNKFKLTITPEQKVVLMAVDESDNRMIDAVLELLLRLRDIHSKRSCGCVTLNDVNVKRLNSQWLRQQIGFVDKTPRVFDQSIEYNIAYGDNSRKVTLSDVKNAAQQSGIAKLISDLPDGYNTNVHKLDLNQKRRVALARALVKNPHILLFDRVTEDLNPTDAQSMIDTVYRVSEGRTAIIVSHNLEETSLADHTILMHEGAVVEQSVATSVIGENSKTSIGEWYYAGPNLDFSLYKS